MPLFDLLKNFRSGVEAHAGSSRFSGSNLNADMLGLLLAIGLPLAWYLFLHGRGAVRALSLIYLPAGPFGLLLTGTRGAFLAGLVGFSLIPITLPRLTLRTYAFAGTLLLVGAGSLALVPQSNWDRMATIPREIVGGRMTGRSAIWRAGLQAFHDHEILGAGAGAYAEAAQPYYHTTRGLYAHNLPVNLLVEGGVIGFGIFAALLGACAWTILHLRPPDRALWCVLMLTWAVGNGSVSLESAKLAWGTVRPHRRTERPVANGRVTEAKERCLCGIIVHAPGSRIKAVANRVTIHESLSCRLSSWSCLNVSSTP